jgi:hypothetical protein
MLLFWMAVSNSKSCQAVEKRAIFMMFSLACFFSFLFQRFSVRRRSRRALMEACVLSFSFHGRSFLNLEPSSWAAICSSRTMRNKLQAPATK